MFIRTGDWSFFLVTFGDCSLLSSCLLSFENRITYFTEENIFWLKMRLTNCQATRVRAYSTWIHQWCWLLTEMCVHLYVLFVFGFLDFHPRFEIYKSTMPQKLDFVLKRWHKIVVQPEAEKLEFSHFYRFNFSLTKCHIYTKHSVYWK